MRPSILRRTAVIVTAGLALVSCVQGGSASPPGPPSGPLPSKVNVGVAIDVPGWGLLQGHSRSGFDYDFANWLANELHFTATFVDLPTNQREQMLRNGQVDLVTNTFSMTDDRATRVSFAGPYVVTQQGVLVRNGDTRIRTVGDLKGKTVCAAAGSTSVEQLKTMELTLREEIGHGECVDALLAGLIDAVSTDQLILFGYAKADQGNRLVVIPDLVFGHQERYGIGFEHGNLARCNELRDAIHSFIASGKWDDFFQNNLPNVQDRAKHRPDPNLLDPCE